MRCGYSTDTATVCHSLTASQGLWQDSQIAPLKRVVDFCHTQGSKVGVQLAHAGRKASTYAPWVQADPARLNVAPKRGADADEGGWPDKVYGPSTLAYSKEFHSPKDMTEDDMKYVEDAFATAVRRSITVGFDFIEVHCAHGYLLNEWLSPLSNNRTDEYGGSLENRMRFPIRILDATRKAFGDRPIMLRISATDFLNGPDGPEKNEKGEYIQWGIEQSKIYCAKAVELGYVDFLDISAAGNWADQKMNIFPGCQVPFATAIKEAIPQVPVGTVGLITEAQQAEDILSSGRADVVLMARELLRDPNFPLRAANTLGTAVKPPNQYERAWGRMLTPAKPAESVVERTKEQGSEGAKP
jgi:2,4-dienoyl-CoA reductase-like NADH-dependent reductase (Old Yellow Enzyme family)